MDAFRARITNALTTAGCPLSADQLVALDGALADAAQDDEGMPMVAAIMTQYGKTVRARVSRSIFRIRRRHFLESYESRYATLLLCYSD